MNKHALQAGRDLDAYLMEVFDHSGPSVKLLLVMHHGPTGTTVAENVLEVSVSSSYSTT